MLAAAVEEPERAVPLMSPPEGNGSEESPPDADLATQQTQEADLEGGDSPDLTEKLKAQLQVCRTIKPGCTHWNVKANEFPKENRPSKVALRMEVQRRDPTRKPAHWDVGKLCAWLRDNEGKQEQGKESGDAETPPSQGQGRPAAGGGTPSSEAEVEAVEVEVDPNKVRRWVQNKQTVRLVHAVLETKEQFLVRDKKPVNRVALEGEDRKWYWHNLSKKFNDPGFNPAVRETQTDTEFKGFSAAYDGFPGSTSRIVSLIFLVDLRHRAWLHVAV